MNTAENNLQKELKKVSARDREYIQSGLDMLGPDPESLGHMKNIRRRRQLSHRVFSTETRAVESVTERCHNLGRVNRSLCPFST